MKRFIAILLCVLMIVPQAAMGSLAAVIDPVTGYEMPIKMEVVGTQPLHENVHGDWREHYVYETGEFVQWFEYECAKAKADVMFYYEDGSTKVVNVDDIGGFSFGSSQRYETQWAVGTHEAQLFYYGENDCLWENPLSCTYSIEIVENPIDSIEVTSCNTIKEGFDGHYAYYYPENGGYIPYYAYWPSTFVNQIKVNYKNGTSEYIDYENIRSECDVTANQNHENQWKGGNSYPATLTYHNVSVDFDVYITPNNIEKIEICNVKSFIDGMDGETRGDYIDGEYVEYTYYWPYEAILDEKILITYTDGTSEIEYMYHIDEYNYHFVHEEQSYNNQWTAGNTYPVTLMCLGREIAFDVSVIDDPIANIEAIHVPVITEGENGRYLSGYDYETDSNGYYYAYYSEYLLNTLRINYTDGTYEDYSFRDLFYKNESWLEYDQSYNNKWIGGGTYPVTVHYGSHSCDFDVYIAPNNIVSIEPVNVRPLIEGQDGYLEQEYDPETGEWDDYFYYNVHNAFDGIRLNYDDGTSKIVYPWDCEQYISQDQSYFNQWTVGNSYSVTVHTCAKMCTLEIPVIADPIESIEAYELNEVVEGTNGSLGEDYDPETDTNKRFYYYDPHSFIKSLKINYVDGTSEIVAFEDFEYTDCRTNQGYSNQWKPGNKYEIILVKGTREFPIEVEIVPSGIERFEIIGDPVLIHKEHSFVNTWWTEDGEVEYDVYRVWEAYHPLQFKIYNEDGTVDVVDGFNLDYSLDYTQDYYNQWTPGNTYPVTVWFGGRTVTIDVAVVANPIESIQVYETRPLEEYNYGWWHTQYDENGNEHRWFEYSPSDAIVSLLISYTDGTSEVVERSYMDGWSTWHGQSYENQWTVGNTYTSTIEFKGFEFSFDVSIVEYCPFEYFVQDGGVFITGVKEYWYFSDNNITDFVIPSEIAGYPVIGVTGIGGNCDGIQTLTIPASVIHLSDYALSSFYNVETVYIEGTETFLCPEVFGSENNIKEFVLNEDHTMYTEIDGVIFDKEMTTIKAYPVAKGSTYELPITISDLSFKEFYSGVNFIIHPDSEMFITENGITYNVDKTQIIACDKTVSGDYVMPETVESISAHLFEECDNLTSIKISSKVTTIAYATFAGCDNLKSVILPESLSSIGEYAFAECVALDSIEFPSELTIIGSRSFMNSGLKAVTIPGSLGVVEYEAFINCKLESVVVEDSKDPELGLEIHSSVFRNNKNLKTVVLGEGLYYLGSYAFQNCTSLVSINIPDTLTEAFGVGIFGNCDSLTYIPIGKYQTLIPDSEFNNCDGLVDITIPDTIIYINDSAFNSCSNLKNVVIPDSVTYVGDYVFAYCTSLEYAPVGAGQTYIAGGEFKGCTGIEEFIVPENIESIEFSAFSNCTKLANVEIHDKLVYIGPEAFSGCTALKHFDTGNTITDIEVLTFANSGLESINIGSSVHSIWMEAFINSNLTSVTIPSNVTEIAYFAFYNCQDLSEITMPETLVSLDGHTFGKTAWYDKQPEGPVYLGTSFYNYKGDIPEGTDKELYIKEGTLGIAGHAFENTCPYTESWSYNKAPDGLTVYDMSGLKSVHMPEGLLEIGYYAFYDCYGLTEVYLPSTLEMIRYGAFEGCSNLTTVYFAGSEEQWMAIEGRYELDGYNIVFNHVDEAPEKVTVTIDGVQAEYAVGETITLEAELFTFNPETNKMYVFAGWIVNGADIVDNGDGTFALTIGSADASVVKNTFVHGSADGDDTVTASDITAVIKKMKSTDLYSILCDIDLDGSVTASDITGIIKIMKGQYSYEG